MTKYKMGAIKTWEEIGSSLAKKELTHFEDWLKDQYEEKDMTVFVTGIFEKDF